MNKSSYQSNHNDEEINNIYNPVRCKKKNCNEWALTLSQFCWKHMPEKKKSIYKKWIEKLIKGNISLKGAILIKADLRGANLSEAVFEKADLTEADLKHSNLSKANLTAAWLSKADLWDCNLSDACLAGSNLSGALLISANISGADFSFANLSEANFHLSNLSRSKLYEAKLESTILCDANLSKVENLRMRSFSKRLSKIEKEDPEYYFGSYQCIKNYFIKNSLYDDASEAAYRERILMRLSFFQLLKYESKKRYINPKKSKWKTEKTLLEKVLLTTKNIILNPMLFLKAFLKTFSSLIWSALCGYGEKPLRTVVAALVIILGYGSFYWYANVLEPAQDWLGSMYFSIVTFTTLGYGDIKPIEYDNLFRFICSSEAFIGAFMIALFVWTLARRGAAR